MAKKMIRLKISDLMEKKGVNTAQLVEKTGIAYNTALGLRRGVATRLDLDVMARVCEALEVQPGELFELVDVNND